MKYCASNFSIWQKCQYIYFCDRMTPTSAQVESDKDSENQSNNQITNYIIDILKRDVNLPIIKSETTSELSESQMNEFIKSAINIIKFEYIEKQKKVVIEFQKR